MASDWSPQPNNHFIVLYKEQWQECVIGPKHESVKRIRWGLMCLLDHKLRPDWITYFQRDCSTGHNIVHGILESWRDTWVGKPITWLLYVVTSLCDLALSFLEYKIRMIDKIILKSFCSSDILFMKCWFCFFSFRKSQGKIRFQNDGKC